MIILSYHYRPRLGWIRIFGYGIKWKDVRKHPLIFSERYGLTKYIKIGNWSISILKKDKA